MRDCNMKKGIFTEGQLLALRAGIWNWTEGTDFGTTVCPIHRYKFGIGWRPNKRCIFPKHMIGTSLKSHRGMSKEMCETAQLRWGYMCRVGSGICRQCMVLVSPSYSSKDHDTSNEAAKKEIDQITEPKDMSATEISIQDAHEATITDKNEPTFDVTYENDAHETTITDKNEPIFEVTYENDAHEATITDKNETTFDVTYENDAHETTITDKNEPTFDVTYENDAHETTITDKNEPTFDVTYENDAHEATITDKNETTFDVTYENDAHETTITDKNETTFDVTYENDAHETTIIDKNETTFDVTYENNSQTDMSSQQSQQSNWSDEVLDFQLPKVNNVMKSLNVSPLRSQLKCDIKSAKPSTMRYYKRKAEETINNMLDLIAPSQGKILKKEVISKDSIDQEASLVDTLIKMYQNTYDNTLKSQILSVLSMKKTKVELQGKIPGLTHYRIDQARGIYNKTTSHRLEIKEKVKTYRHKMDSAQVDHAMGFFSDPAFMQLVSYGTREIQLDSGERLTIPEVIRTSCHSKMIDLYLSYCEDTSFTPLSKSSLFRILNSYEAKKRTNLHGLDNITADGIDAFESLLDITKCFKEDSILSTEQYEEITKNIREARSYLKSDFKLHLEKDSLCADHCLNWLLSDPNIEEFKAVCNHEHTLTCDRCEILKSIEKKIDTIISQIQNGDKKDEVKKKFMDAMVNVHGWKSHIIRTVNQDLFRIEVLENLRQNEGVLVMDWAMKFLPMRHREKQTDWFGQRGIHWHVSVLIYRTDDGEIGHRTFTHVLERVKQDWYAVASLLDHVLTTVRKQLPQISEVYIRSDNAGCYHCGNLWLAIPRISEITGIKVRQYCYSEAQAGKSYCDSKIAHMRTKMRSYVANGKDILSASDMKTAIDHGSGVTGCQVASVIIDTRYNITKNHQLKNVSLYNDVIYLPSNEMILKKQFNVGIGMKVFESTTQKRFGCNIIRDFDVPNKVTGQIKLKQNVDVAGTCEIPRTIPSEVVQDETVLENSHMSQTKEQESGYQFPCPETGCTKSFASHRTLDQHLITGKHDVKLYRESTYDLIKKQWAELCNNVVIVFHKNKQSVSQNTEPMNIIGMGYGLKKQKKVNRFSPSVKLYLEQKFKEGEQSGKKYLPKDIEIEMRNLRDSNGNRAFPINDCLNSSQILSFFSRLSSKSCKFEDD